MVLTAARMPCTVCLSASAAEPEAADEAAQGGIGPGRRGRARLHFAALIIGDDAGDEVGLALGACGLRLTGARTARRRC